MMHIYTDGSCHGNPGPGGWGVCCYMGNDLVCEFSGFEENTTNNRMELMAVIQCLHKYQHVESEIIIYTDSMYVMKGITQWIKKWKENNWMTSKKEQVKNKDLWMMLDASLKHNASIQWCKGHANNAGNERADYLANSAIQDNLKKIN
jgi:ribonuclease HI